MAEADDSIAQWENDFKSENGAAIVPSDTIDFAQNLQLGMLDAKPEQRFHMGMMALELLHGHPNPLQHNDYVLRTAYRKSVSDDTYQSNDARRSRVTLWRHASCGSSRALCARSHRRRMDTRTPSI